MERNLEVLHEVGSMYMLKELKELRIKGDLKTSNYMTMFVGIFLSGCKGPISDRLSLEKKVQVLIQNTYMPV